LFGREVGGLFGFKLKLQPYLQISPRLLTHVLEILFSSNEIHTLLSHKIIVFTFECQARITTTIIKWKFSQKQTISASFLGLKFYKNIRFSLSEYCEWGSWSLPVLLFLKENVYICLFEVTSKNFKRIEPRVPILWKFSNFMVV
jgi:hypothetical protein